jgi:hypothetical protein
LDDIPLPGPVEAIYRYTDPDSGTIELAVLRYRDADRKAFCQATPVEGGWVRRGVKEARPLYNRTRVRGAEHVVVCEGEKCVHALHQAGIVATTSPGGAKAADKADWSPLAGKRVCLWPDNDEAGMRYADAVQAALERLDPPVSIARIDPANLDLPAHGDAADYLQAGRDARTAINEATSVSGRGLKSLIDAVVAGQRETIPFPWEAITYWSRALQPGKVTLLCGEPGAGKSFWMLQAMLHWHRQGHRISLYEFEADMEEWMRRTLAQLAEEERVTDYDWIKAHPKKAYELNEAHWRTLESFRRRVTCEAVHAVTYEDTLRWVEQQVSQGSELIGIDPVTAIDSEGRPWIEDKRFMRRLTGLMTVSGKRALLVTHPRVASKGAPIGMDYLAGGAAFQRASQTILWLRKHDTKTAQVRTKFGPCDVEHNRTLAILKARCGPGMGLHLAGNFVPQSLTFEELGILVP